MFMYKNKKFFILGMARSGYEVAKLLAKDNTVFITDMKEQDGDKVKELESLGVTFILSDNPTDLLDDSYDIMVKNPGIKYDHPTVVKAKNMGIPVINEVEVAYHYLDHDVNIIGVTGSNGKTTTVSIIYEIMKKAFGDKVFLAGNIGTPLCHFVSDIKSGDYLVMEISDHQLCDMYEFKTNVSVMTNIYDCHADFHDGHDKYVQTKKKIFMNHGKDDVNIINKDNKEEMAITRDISGVNYYFNGKDAYFYPSNPWFNVILLRGLLALAKVDNKYEFVNTMADNARYAWQYTRDENGFLGNDWAGIDNKKFKWLLDNACMIELFAETGNIQ